MLLKKKNLVNYIISEHYRIMNKPICSLKLHCSLYYLYAMWGGKTYPSKDREYLDYYSNYDSDLFNASFEGWKYGPRDVSVAYRNLKQKGVKLNFLTKDKEQKEVAQEYIDSLLSILFRTHEFALVDLFCEDKCFKLGRMDNKEIKEVYSSA